MHPRSASLIVAEQRRAESLVVVLACRPFQGGFARKAPFIPPEVQGLSRQSRSLPFRDERSSGTLSCCRGFRTLQSRRLFLDRRGAADRRSPDDRAQWPVRCPDLLGDVREKYPQRQGPSPLAFPSSAGPTEPDSFDTGRARSLFRPSAAGHMGARGTVDHRASSSVATRRPRRTHEDRDAARSRKTHDRRITCEACRLMTYRGEFRTFRDAGGVESTGPGPNPYLHSVLFPLYWVPPTDDPICARI